VSDYGGVYLGHSTASPTSEVRARSAYGYLPRNSPFKFEDQVGLPVQRWLPLRTFVVADSSYRFRYVVIPHWVFVTLFAIPPLLRFRAWRRQRRRAIAGTRAKCGYDLRATPERCPECGTMPT